MITFVPGLQYALTAATLSEIQAYGDTLGDHQFALKMLANTCGFYASKIPNYTEEQLDALKLPKWEREYFKSMGDAWQVNIIKDVAAGLTEKERLAILLHEEAHVVFQHATKINESQVNNIHGMKIMDVVEFEIEADNYAASKVGAKTVITALTKTIVKSCDILRNCGAEVNASNALLDSNFRSRINALESLIN